MKSKPILVGNNPNNIAKTFKPVTIIIDNNPNNMLQEGALNISIKRLLPNKPTHKAIKKKYCFSKNK